MCRTLAPRRTLRTMMRFVRLLAAAFCCLTPGAGGTKTPFTKEYTQFTNPLYKGSYRVITAYADGTELAAATIALGPNVRRLKNLGSIRCLIVETDTPALAELVVNDLANLGQMGIPDFPVFGQQAEGSYVYGEPSGGADVGSPAPGNSVYWGPVYHGPVDSTSDLRGAIPQWELQTDHGLDRAAAKLVYDSDANAGSSGFTTVALLDTGVSVDHPGIKKSLWINPGEIPGNGLDDDGNGYVDDVHGIDLGRGRRARD